MTATSSTLFSQLSQGQKGRLTNSNYVLTQTANQAKLTLKSIATEPKAQMTRRCLQGQKKANTNLMRVKFAFFGLMLFSAIFTLGLGCYSLYILVSEKPMFKLVTEKIIQKNKPAIIPEECTQVRRNAQIYISCNGVTINGAPTLEQSGLTEIPELISN